MQNWLGTVVYSKSGRDKGKMFIIIGVVDENFVLLADGDLRKNDNPKRKNIKHIQKTHIVAEEIRSSINEGVVPENHVIKKTLKKIQESGELRGKEV